MTVTVIDSIMGSGKTSFAIQTMKNAPIDKKFIYITPFLSEVQRIKESMPERNFKEPNVRHGKGTKLKSLKRLVAEGENIATTHSLFSLIDEELEQLLGWGNYTLIVDEVMEVIHQLKLKPDDIKVLQKSELVEIEEGTNRVIWKAEPELNTQYNEVKEYALSGNLYSVNGTAFVWNFPVSIFGLFDEVIIMTYMFDGQLQKYYYDYHNIDYNKQSVIQADGVYKLVPYSKEDRSKYKELINIYEGHLNEIGDKNSLSKGWFENPYNKSKITKLKNALYSYIRNDQKAKQDEVLWTTFKDYRTKLQGKGFTKSFLSFTTRATNEFKDKSVLAFCLNRFMIPIEKQFFTQRDIKVDQDLLALSDLLQWIFRSRIREGQPIEIYIPSKRMRTLLYKWLDGEL
ncbi:DEAD/DEAH box helicase family protein [Bacillus luti]|uniref:DEAD/DEAH box helicase family protein n=1 Tax=Bacillus luti TaxID=2026191 RepID=UPI003D049F1A